MNQAPAASGVPTNNAPTTTPQNNNNNNNTVRNPYEPSRKRPRTEDSVDDNRFQEFDSRSKSTTQGHALAIKKWNEFAETNNNIFGNPHIPKFNELTAHWVCGELLGDGMFPRNYRNPPIQKFMAKFCAYLLGMKKGTGDEYQPFVVVQYLSSFKTVLFNKFKPLGFMSGDDSPQWYKDLYHGLRLRACNACITRGGRISKKAIGFAKETLRECCLYLCKHQNDTKLGLEERAVLTILYHAVGRGGEVALTVWENVSWDADGNHIALDWGETKTSNQYLMTFHPDSSDWVLDSIHALACYVLANPSSSKGSTSEADITFMFPAYASIGNVSDKVSRVLDKCRKTDKNKNGVETIPPEAASHSIRVSSFNQSLVGSTLIEAISRGGWEMNGSNAFLYVTQPLHVKKAGKALAGWRYPEQHVTAPTLDSIINESNRQQVFKFVDVLFHESVVSALLNNELKEVRNVFAASLLMYYTPVLNDLGSDFLVIRRIHNAARQSDIDFTVIKQWGDDIRNHFIVTNAENLGGVDGTVVEQQQRCNAILQETCSKLLVQNQELMANGVAVKKTGEDTLQVVLEVKDMLGSLSLNGNGGREGGVATSNGVGGTTSSNPTAPSNLSSSNPPRDAFGVMNTRRVITEAYDWPNMTKWQMSTFVKAIVKSGQDAETIQPFLKSKGGCDARSMSTLRTRAKKMTILIFDLIPDAEKKYFDYRQLPKDHNGIMEWSDTVSSLASKWELLVRDSLFTRYVEALEKMADNPACANLLSKAQKKKRNTNLEIGSLAGVLEEVEKYEKRVAQVL